MTDSDLGRIIVRLRSHRKRKWSRQNYWRSYTVADRFWTDKQIMEALHLTPDRFKECLKAYEHSGPRFFTPSEWRPRYVAFFKQEKRWPTRHDCRNWRETGLHSDRAAYRWFIDREIETYARANPRSLTPEMVFTIPNLTVRRDIIDRLGGPDRLVARLIKEGKAVQLQQDDFGTLWRLNFQDGADSHMRYVEVVNSTPKVNKNGKVIKRGGEPVYDHYFLRVPPGTRTARAGVAWTFDQPEETFAGFVAQS